MAALASRVRVEHVSHEVDELLKEQVIHWLAGPEVASANPLRMHKSSNTNLHIAETILDSLAQVGTAGDQDHPLTIQAKAEWR